jgi:hypothetical protein
MLRSTGFAASGLDAVTDPDLARQADSCLRSETTGEQYAKAFAEAEKRLAQGIAAVARDPDLRTAVAWQNPQMLTNMLDRMTSEVPRRKKERKRERAVSAYLQRYTHKNDTIGFYGPAAWARFSPGRPFSVRTGPDLVRERRTYFENWAIDELATVLARREEIRPWLVPRRVLANSVSGGVLHRPRKPKLTLTHTQRELLDLCDGQATVTDLTTKLPHARVEDVEELHALGAVHLDLIGPVEARPERTLRAKLGRIGDPLAREYALGCLDALEQARERLHEAGSAEQVMTASAQLEDQFTEMTGAEATRRPGQTYAGRTLAFQDTIRDVDVHLGVPVLDAMAPLDLLLRSAQWLVAQSAEHYRAAFDRLFDAETRRRGTDSLNLAYLVSRSTSDLTAIDGVLPPPVAQAQREFQRRWAQILRPPVGTRRYRVAGADIVDLVRESFPERGTPWSAAKQHAPDVMIAAQSPEAVNQGDFTLVLGELHLARNTVDNPPFVYQHPDAAELVRLDTADHGGDRIYAAPPKNSPFVSSRTAPPTTLRSDEYLYWFWSGEAESIDPPGPVLPGADLVVRRSGDELVVHSPSLGTTYDLLEVLGEILSTAVTNAFRLFPSRPHTPRVTIDRFTVQREAWTFEAQDTSWANIKDEKERFLQARAWRMKYGIPERSFYKVPTETKPSAVDFRSLPLVNAMAKHIRDTQGKPGASFASFGVSEMLPTGDQLWLTDGAGRSYTSELRIIAAAR